jgi:hypothetical protein
MKKMIVPCLAIVALLWLAGCKCTSTKDSSATAMPASADTNAPAK